MLAHLGQFLGRQPARLVEHGVGDPNLADVVKRRQAGKEFHAIGRQVVAIGWMFGELLGQHVRVLLCPHRVPPGLQVPNAGQ